MFVCILYGKANTHEIVLELMPALGALTAPPPPRGDWPGTSKARSEILEAGPRGGGSMSVMAPHASLHGNAKGLPQAPRIPTILRVLRHTYHTYDVMTMYPAQGNLLFPELTQAIFDLLSVTEKLLTLDSTEAPVCGRMA